MLMGDLNAKLGQRYQIFDPDQVIKNNATFEFCGLQKMVVGGIIFSHMKWCPVSTTNCLRRFLKMTFRRVFLRFYVGR
jgi:hypothetical protein